MKKSKFKILFYMVILLIIFLSNVSFATIDTSQYKSITQIGESDMGIFRDIGGKILYVVQFVGYSVAVIMLAVMGIKYIISSPEQKADLKTRFTPYAIGAVLLFGGSSILNIIYRIMT